MDVALTIGGGLPIDLEPRASPLELRCAAYPSTRAASRPVRDAATSCR